MAFSLVLRAACLLTMPDPVCVRVCVCVCVCRSVCVWLFFLYSCAESSLFADTSSTWDEGGEFP